MTREDSIRTKTWVTDDGRCLTVDEITPDHLLRIEEMLRRELTPGYDEEVGREIRVTSWPDARVSSTTRLI